MTTNKELLAIRDKATPQGVSVLHEIFTDKARNAELWDVEGRRYIDLSAGIAVTNVEACIDDCQGIPDFRVSLVCE